nr:PREDICTED: thrombospondin-2-like [Linepithema humile]
MNRIRLVSAHVVIFLFFMAYKEAALEINEASNIIPKLAESNINNTLRVNLKRLRRKSSNIEHNDDSNREEDIRPYEIKRAGRNDREPKIWDQWGNWSTCSVTCGIGKIMRWRHCIGGSCSLGEKKAQLKTCTSAAC